MRNTKLYNKLQSKMINLMTFKKKSDEDAFRMGMIMIIIAVQFSTALFFYENYFANTKGITKYSSLIIIIPASILGLKFLELLFQNFEKKNNIVDDEIKTLPNQNCSHQDNLMMELFEIFSEKEIYKKGKGNFGLERYSFESKTQLAVILCVIKFDSHKHKFSNLPQNKFLLTFKENFKNGFSLGDKEFKDKIDFTESFFSSIKKDLFEFDKMNNNILRLNQNSQYYQLYNDFLKILITKDI